MEDQAPTKMGQGPPPPPFASGAYGKIAPVDPLVKWGWIAVVLSLLLPIVAIAGVIVGGIVSARGKAGHGVAMICVSLVLGTISFLVWSAVLSPTPDGPRCSGYDPQTATFQGCE